MENELLKSFETDLIAWLKENGKYRTESQKKACKICVPKCNDRWYSNWSEAFPRYVTCQTCSRTPRKKILTGFKNSAYDKDGRFLLNDLIITYSKKYALIKTIKSKGSK